MNPLLLQIAIGAGGLLLGFLIGTVAAGRRLRNTREAARKQSDDLESRLALERLRIRELEGRIEAAAAGDLPEPIPDALAQMPSVTPTRPKWLASPPERTPNSAPPRA